MNLGEEPVMDAVRAPMPEPELPQGEPAGPVKGKPGRPRKYPEGVKRPHRKTSAPAGNPGQTWQAKPADDGAVKVEVPGLEASDNEARPMKLTKREAQELLDQVFSMPASMLEPAIFGTMLIPGKVATVRVDEEETFEVSIPEHLAVTRQGAIQGIAVLVDGVELDPRWVAAGMVAVHCASLGAVYWQIASEIKKRRKAKEEGAEDGAGK